EQGGHKTGHYLIRFMEAIQKPVVITFHSIVPKPVPEIKRVVHQLAKKAACIIVMTETGVKILRNIYGVKTDIGVIPHGIPNVAFKPSREFKKQLGYEERLILSSFGMMNPDKGYEHVIAALPRVVEKFANVLYLIVGATHPIVRKHNGEQYRNFLKKRVRELNLQNHVKFYNKYINTEEIVRFLHVTDIYISTGLNPGQITSGTLSYALGCGKAIISTPFLHAKDAISPERGILVRFRDPESYAEAIIRLLSDEGLRRSMEKAAYQYSRHMTWPEVAKAHERLYREIIGYSKASRLPEIKLEQLKRLTDDFGIIQFARRTEPDTDSGYTLDDNARAMIACCMHYNIFREEENLNDIKRFLEFIRYVLQNDGRLFNYVKYNKEIELNKWTDDAHARALWALGFLSSSKLSPELGEEAATIFKEAMNHDVDDHPRTAAFTIMGLYSYNKFRPSAENIKEIRKLANYLTALYDKNSSCDWHWFENKLTYSNARLPEALIYAYLATKEERYLEVAEKTLNHLCNVCFEGSMLVLVGNNGWYRKRKEKARYDQQPVDASSMVQALLLAYQVTEKQEYMELARMAFQWFLGKNSLKMPVYDETSGGCHDGVNTTHVNANEGAESTATYLIARLAMEFVEQGRKLY
ncbi:hypothetical protein COV22_01115, partial [Candidatus Woesearchaeota archaeon CG10_big_fil_rev_8_21_14_0_10_47_5]